MVHSLMIIGSQGFIGRHFCRAFPAAKAISRQQLDLCDDFFSLPEGRYDYALITAGMGNPKTCMENPALSYACNVTGTLKLGKALLKRGILPIFFSSDYVLNEALEEAPLNLYGEQKLEIERKGSEIGGLVIRLSKVYGLKKGDGTLFDEMAARLVNGQSIRAAYDQIFSPIWIEDVICRVIYLAQKGIKGVVSLVGPHYGSRFEMASYLGKCLQIKEGLIEKIALDDLGDGIKRPKCLSLKGDFLALRWQEGVEKVAKNYES